jgi:hypothetical protein
VFERVQRLRVHYLRRLLLLNVLIPLPCEDCEICALIKNPSDPLGWWRMESLIASLRCKHCVELLTFLGSMPHPVQLKPKILHFHSDVSDLLEFYLECQGTKDFF